MVSLNHKGFGLRLVDAGEIDFQLDLKGKPAVVSRAQRNIRRNAEVRVELDIFLARMELQISAKTGRVTKTEEMFRSGALFAGAAEFFRQRKFDIGITVGGRSVAVASADRSW
jgi:hypothetical protein